MYWIFKADGSFSLEKGNPGNFGSRPGTYKMNGKKITGTGTNPSAPGSVKTYSIDFTVEGNTLSGTFHEDWGNPGGKTLTVVAVKQ